MYTRNNDEVWNNASVNRSAKYLVTDSSFRNGPERRKVTKCSQSFCFSMGSRRRPSSGGKAIICLRASRDSSSLAQEAITALARASADSSSVRAAPRRAEDPPRGRRWLRRGLCSRRRISHPAYPTMHTLPICDMRCKARAGIHADIPSARARPSFFFSEKWTLQRYPRSAPVPVAPVGASESKRDEGREGQGGALPT